MSKCNKCPVLIESENEPGASIKCVYCIKMFHPSCVGLTKTLMKNVCNQKSFKWNCDECSKEVDMNVLIIEKLNIIEQSLKNRDQVIENLSKQVKELSNKIQPNNCNSVSGTPAITPSGGMKRSWAEITGENNEFRTPISENNVPNTPKRIKFANKLPARKADDNVLIVKTKAKPNENGENSMETGVVQLSESAADVVKRSLDPAKDNVKIARQTANGHIVLQCKDKQSMNTIKMKLCAAAGDTHDVAEPKVYKPLVKTHNLEPKYENKTLLLSDLRTQNPEIFNSDSTITVIDCKQYKQRVSNAQKENTTDKQLFYATLEIDIETFRRVIDYKHVLCGWHRCPVYEHVMVLRCFKCNQYGHIANECKESNAICALCSGQHEMKECKSTEYNCVNCTKYNEKYRTKVDPKHPAFSIKCPVMCKKIDERKKHIRYES